MSHYSYSLRDVIAFNTFLITKGFRDCETCQLLAAPPYDFRQDDGHQRTST
ncbi:mCG133245, isoform CRA_b [Mus musculus]|nr:mCG133245, isoform CRA_b [Mus musculus]